MGVSYKHTVYIGLAT